MAAAIIRGPSIAALALRRLSSKCRLSSVSLVNVASGRVKRTTARCAAASGYFLARRANVIKSTIIY